MRPLPVFFRSPPAGPSQGVTFPGHEVAGARAPIKLFTRPGAATLSLFYSAMGRSSRAHCLREFNVSSLLYFMLFKKDRVDAPGQLLTWAARDHDRLGALLLSADFAYRIG